MPPKNEPAGLAQWLLRLKADLTEEGPISRVELLHTVEGEGFERLERFNFRDDTDTEDAAQILHTAAVHDSETRTSGQVQRYSVLAYRTPESREPECSYGFLIRVNTAKLLIGGDSEPPTDKGSMAHYMRHDENMHRMMMQSQEAIVGRLTADIDMERRRRIASEQAELTHRKETEDLLDRKLEREIERAERLASSRRSEDMWGVFIAMAPLVIGKFIGGDKERMPSAARELAIQKLLSNLSMEEIEGVLKSLKPHNQLPLFELIKSFNEDEVKEQNKRPEVLKNGSEEKKEEKDSEENGEATKH